MLGYCHFNNVSCISSQIQINSTVVILRCRMTVMFTSRNDLELTVQPSSVTLYVKRLLPSALISISLEPCSRRAFFRLPEAWSMYAMLFLQWYVMFWEASVDMRRRKVSWMLTSSALEPSLPYSNCRFWEESTRKWANIINRHMKKKSVILFGLVDVLTWKPSVMASPNQTCFFSLMFLLVYQVFLGMVDSVG